LTGAQKTSLARREKSNTLILDAASHYPETIILMADQIKNRALSAPSMAAKPYAHLLRERVIMIHSQPTQEEIALEM